MLIRLSFIETHVYEVDFFLKKIHLCISEKSLIVPISKLQKEKNMGLILKILCNNFIKMHNKIRNKIEDQKILIMKSSIQDYYNILVLPNEV